MNLQSESLFQPLRHYQYGYGENRACVACFHVVFRDTALRRACQGIVKNNKIIALENIMLYDIENDKNKQLLEDSR